MRSPSTDSELVRSTPWDLVLLATAAILAALHVLWVLMQGLLMVEAAPSVIAVCVAGLVYSVNSRLAAVLHRRQRRRSAEED